jgi:hypothetical protein
VKRLPGRREGACIKKGPNNDKPPQARQRGVVEGF